jgi:hypothetical protein
MHGIYRCLVIRRKLKNSNFFLFRSLICAIDSLICFIRKYLTEICNMQPTFTRDQRVLLQGSEIELVILVLNNRDIISFTTLNGEISTLTCDFNSIRL